MTTATVTTSQLSTVHHLFPDMTMKQMVILMYLAERDGATVMEVANALCFNQSVVSRVVRVMGCHDKGTGLVEQRLDPYDSRRRQLHLSQKALNLITTTN